MAEGGFRIALPLDLSDPDHSDNFAKWKRLLVNFMFACGASKKPPATRVAIILHCTGPAVLNLAKQFTNDGS